MMMMTTMMKQPRFQLQQVVPIQINFLLHLRDFETGIPGLHL